MENNPKYNQLLYTSPDSHGFQFKYRYRMIHKYWISDEIKYIGQSYKMVPTKCIMQVCSCRLIPDLLCSAHVGVNYCFATLL